MNTGKSWTWQNYVASLDDANKISKQHRSIDYVYKVDSDTLLDILGLIDFTRDNLPPAPHNANTYGGHARRQRLVNNEWVKFPSPVAMGGNIYFLSIDLAHHV